MPRIVIKVRAEADSIFELGDAFEKKISDPRAIVAVMVTDYLFFFNLKKGQNLWSWEMYYQRLKFILHDFF